ncbi:MAG TPA: NADH-quinone oxidoreductase subunit N, partial [Phnomibacter sp.]|nr:NADH-quinone oxidoreductase subunit N [Phnomibacter sp.]
NTSEMSAGAPWLDLPVEGMLQTSRFGLLMNGIILLASLMYFIVSGRHIEQVSKHVADHYALIFFILAGAGISTSFVNLLMLFLGIEIMTIPLYILTGADKRNLKSNEASLKYFLMGAFSTGIMLMGIAMIYGGTGSFMVAKMNIEATPLSYYLVTGVLLLLISMSFKVSAVPFHFWTPDVYDGAPTVFTSFMATIVKVAAFSAFVLLFADSTSVFPREKWKLVIAIIIALTLIVGNITAVFQQSVKRMLAYSSISQAGFMMFAVFSFNYISNEGIIIYAAAYCFATIGLFAVLLKMDDYTFEGFNGLAKREPQLAALASIFLLSLAGIPITAGFFGKYYMVASALRSGGSYLWLVIIAMLCAAISVYYYFRVIQAMYFKDAATTDVHRIEASSAFRFGLLVLAALILVVGIMPQMLLQYLYF